MLDKEGYVLLRFYKERRPTSEILSPEEARKRGYTEEGKQLSEDIGEDAPKIYLDGFNNMDEYHDILK